jgi:hypothetical protein
MPIHRAPWEPRLLKNLQDHQDKGIDVYRCEYCDSVLVPETDGWFCPGICGHEKQDWAQVKHVFAEIDFGRKPEPEKEDDGHKPQDRTWIHRKQLAGKF